MKRHHSHCRPFDAEPLEARLLLAGVSAGFFNSNYWGAAARVFPADPDLTDGATPGGADSGTGSISLDGVRHDPADPTGIPARDPDVTTVLSGDDTGAFRLHFDAAPAPLIREDNFSAVYTGRIIVPDDGDATGNEDVSIAFIGSSDDDGHLYVDGRLVSTDPGPHQARTALNVAPARLYREGQSLDFVFLHAEGTVAADAAILWSVNGAAPVAVPMASVEPMPTAPAKPDLAVTGTSSHQVSFAITDRSTSEQRFDLYRKPAGALDGAYAKVNEVGINSPFINDASAAPLTAYTYVLRGVNFASGAGEASEAVTATTSAPPPSVHGLNAYYFNDDFWGRGGDARPMPRHDLQGRMNNLFVGPGDAVTGADVHEIVPAVDFDYGVNEHDPAVRPGGSPHLQIRDNSHSTLFTGTLLVTEAGQYSILGFGSDDTYVIVDGQVVSSDPGVHGIRDPRPSPTDNGRPDVSDRYIRPLTLGTGEHDLVVMHSEQDGDSGVRLQWIRPGQPAPEVVPAANLNANTSIPAAGIPTVVPAGSRGTSVLMTFPRTGNRSELKIVFELATDAAFVQNYRKILLGPGNDSFRLFGLTPNTVYFARAMFKNFEWDSASAVGTFNSSFRDLDPPSNLTGRAINPTQVRLAWVDNSFVETEFIVQRRPVGGVFADIATLAANSTAFTDSLDPAGFPPGTQIEYWVMAANSSGRSTPSNIALVKVGGDGGTGLTRRVWNDIDPVSREGVGQPVINELDPLVDDGYGDGPPALGVDPDTFAIEWTGYVVAEQTKGYDFSVVGNDGVRLLLDDKLVIAGGWRDQPDTEYFSEPLFATAGQKIKVRLQMYDNTGAATARLRWNGPGNVREAIPNAFLFPVPVGDSDIFTANIPLRPVTFPQVFGLPASKRENFPATLAIHWQDNAFGEAGYEIQRATNSTFTQNPVTLTSVPGTDLYIDNGGANPSGTATPLDPNTTYFYRIRPVGAPDAAWVNAGSARPGGEDKGDFGLALFNFANPEMVTLNGYTSTTAEGTIKLAHNQNDRSGSAWLNLALDFRYRQDMTFDFQISNSTGGDGMAFVIQNFIPTASPGVQRTQMRALGSGGGQMGYGGITDSVAIVFDFHDNLDTMGVWTNGQTPPGGGLANHPLRDNSANGELFEPNGDVDLRNALNNLPGVGAINLDGGTKFHLLFDYQVDDNLTPLDPGDDTGVLTISLANIVAPYTILHRSRWNVNIQNTLGSGLGVVGWTAANGGVNARQEILSFLREGGDPPPPPFGVYVRGSSWLGDDNNVVNTTFKEYLAAKGLGDKTYGYQVFDAARGSQNPDAILPWLNVDEIVVKFSFTPTGTGIPERGMILHGVKRDYTVVSVVQLDPTTYVLHLSEPLGGNPATAQTNGDKVRFSLGGAGPAGTTFTMVLNVVQGDVDKSGSVLAADYSAAKKKFFKNTNSPTAGTDADYSPFHDVDASGSILANDYSEVKKRFFQALPTGNPPAPASAAASLLDARHIRPALRSRLADLVL